MYKEKKVALSGFLMCLVAVALFLFLSHGCSLFGGSTAKATTKPVSELETELETAQKEIDESKKELKDIQGDVSLFEQRMQNIENIVTIINQQITAIYNSNVQYNESIKSILWAIAGIWITIKVLSFIQMIIAAKVMPGSTVKNVFTLPWEKK